MTGQETADARRDAVRPRRQEAVLLLAHVHDARHERVHRADVAEVALAREGVLVRVVGIETLRREALVVGGHRMWRVVTIRPHDFRPRRDRDLLGIERELRTLPRTGLLLQVIGPGRLGKQDHVGVGPLILQ